MLHPTAMLPFILLARSEDGREQCAVLRRVERRAAQRQCGTEQRVRGKRPGIFFRGGYLIAAVRVGEQMLGLRRELPRRFVERAEPLPQAGQRSAQRQHGCTHPSVPLRNLDIFVRSCAMACPVIAVYQARGEVQIQSGLRAAFLRRPPTICTILLKIMNNSMRRLYHPPLRLSSASFRRGMSDGDGEGHTVELLPGVEEDIP